MLSVKHFSKYLTHVSLTVTCLERRYFPREGKIKETNSKKRNQLEFQRKKFSLTPETQQAHENGLVFRRAGFRLAHGCTAWDPELRDFSTGKCTADNTEVSRERSRLPYKRVVAIAFTHVATARQEARDTDGINPKLAEWLQIEFTKKDFSELLTPQQAQRTCCISTGERAPKRGIQTQWAP